MKTLATPAELWLGAFHQFRQPCDIDGDAPCFIARQHSCGAQMTVQAQKKIRRATADFTAGANAATEKEWSPADLPMVMMIEDGEDGEEDDKGQGQAA